MNTDYSIYGTAQLQGNTCTSRACVSHMIYMQVFQLCGLLLVPINKPSPHYYIEVTARRRHCVSQHLNFGGGNVHATFIVCLTL